MTLLLGATSDSASGVRGAALRALGVFVLFPDLRSDTVFVDDVAHSLVQSMSDKQLNVRVRVSQIFFFFSKVEIEIESDIQNHILLLHSLLIIFF